VFVVGTSDFEFETGAKTIHKYNHEPKAREAETSVTKAGTKTAASVHADAMDEMHENSMDMLPNNMIFAMPQSTSLGPGYYGYKPQLKGGDKEYDPASGDVLANNVASIAAAGKEGADKMTPVLVDGDCTAGSSYPNNILPLAQMRGSIRAYLDDYRRTPNPNITGGTTLSVVGGILSCSILDPSRGLSTISRESSRFAALSDAWKRNIRWELL
jgi:hypothetical protein